MKWGEAGLPPQVGLLMLSPDEVIGSRLSWTYTPWVANDPISIRAHALLCLQGFRGKGYSPAFVKHMGDVAAILKRKPDQIVRVLASRDTFCNVCPHDADGCTLGGEGHEAHIRAQDADVLQRLGLEAGAELPWSTLVRRLAIHVQGIDLRTICTTCPWLPMGWCADEIDAAKHALRAGAVDKA